MIENQKKRRIVSHRLRGFSSHDASLQGLQTALADKINHFELDCRVTKDGAVVIHHDAKLGDEFTEQPYIADKTLAQLKSIHYKNFSGTILTLEELFQTIEPDKQINLYLDIKESGKEEQIINEAAKRNLLENIVIISWLPEVLFKINSLVKTMQLCFSFYPVCNSFSSRILYMQAKARSVFNLNRNQRLTFLFDAYNNSNNVTGKYGFDFEHFVSLPFNGKLVDVLQSVNGIVCVNYKMAESSFIESFKKQNLQICLYSINTEKDLQEYEAKFHPDIILSDNSSLLIHGS
ncbi:MAG: glycerophosphodiester phosphodiesterase family protein [Ignavibacteriaceae bacterium]|jgi:glycerophosphoryl diester phosphodiesterase